MNHIEGEVLTRANREAIYNAYLYLAYKTTPAARTPLKSIVNILDDTFIGTDRERQLVNILKNAVRGDNFLANSEIDFLTLTPGGLTACTFTRPNGDVSAVFKGTGSGEWIDNGEGLSGMPEENTYITYENKGAEMYRIVEPRDYATDRQVEALNWFNRVAALSNWSSLANITVSGHSKGGNKAQFVTIHSDLVDECFSFSGQGFSPEAITSFKNRYGTRFDERRQHIRSLSADNDYVNVLGAPLVPKENVFYFKPHDKLHDIEAILDDKGQFNPQSEQGKFSEYVSSVSDELMRLPPCIRQYATLGVMNIFQKQLGSWPPVSGEFVSAEKTVAGLGIAVGALLHQLSHTIHRR